jgi:membrane fusion protein (multidrug efflux system)
MRRITAEAHARRTRAPHLHSPAMFSLSLLLRALAVPLLVTSLSAQDKPRGKPSAPLKAETFLVRKTQSPRKVSAVGTFRAFESVTLVSELSRRLSKIHVREGASVAAKEVLFKLDDSDLSAELQEINARLQLARINQARANDLLPRRAISQQEFDTTSGEVAILEAQKLTHEVLISKTEIRAPFAGRVGLRNISEGTFVSPTVPLITLQDLSRIQLDFLLPERYASEVAVGQKFSFTIPGSGDVLDGSVSVIEPAIDPSTRSLLVRGLCSQPEKLRPGGFAEVSLTLDGPASGFMIPSQAIVPTPRGHDVFIIANGKAKLQSVEIGRRSEDEVQVLRCLKDGDVIATTGLMRMRPGLPVIPATP